MTLKSLIRSTLLASTALVLATAGLSQAQTIVTPDDDSRSEMELRAEVRRAIDRDTDVANTALVFNNASSQESTVVCRAYGANGDFVGRGVAKIPPRGVRYLRASDLANGADFVGSAVCRTRTRMAASAVFLAPGAITNLDVIQAAPFDSYDIRFPLIATY